MEGPRFEGNPVEERIAIPSDIATLRAKEPARARDIQQKACEQFRLAFDRELAVIGFEKSEPAGTYLIGKWEST